MIPVLAIDIGGTAIKIGIVAARGRILCRRLVPFDSSLQFDALVECIHAVCSDLLADVPAPGRIAIATPGYSLPGSGQLVDGAGNVPVLRDRSIGTALSERFGLPASVENDGIAAARGELLFGAGRNYRRFVVMTIGTGIGGAVVIDDEVISGSNGEPPEFGAIVVGDSAVGTRPMNLEGCASGPALVAAYNRVAALRIDSAEGVFAALAEGNPYALEIVDRSCRNIAQAFGMLVNALSLDACIIGGGVSGAGEVLRDRVRAHLPDFTWPLLMSRVEVHISALGNDAGLLGASADVRRKHDRAFAPLSTTA